MASLDTIIELKLLVLKGHMVMKSNYIYGIVSLELPKKASIIRVAWF